MALIFESQGQRFELPDGTTEEEARRKIAAYRGQAPHQRSALAAAAITRADARGKRGGLERFMDNVSDTWNRSWIAEGFRTGFREGGDQRITEMAFAGLNADGSKRTILDELNPARAVGGIVGAASNIVNRLGGGEGKAVASFSRDMVEDEKTRRAEFDAISERDPFWESEGGLLGKAGQGAAALGGVVVGSAVDPVNWIGFGRTVIVRALSVAGTSGAADLLAQQSATASGVQEDYRLDQTLLSAAAGFTFSGLGDLAGLGLKKWKGRFEATPERAAADVLEVADDLAMPALTHADIPTLYTIDGAKYDDALDTVAELPKAPTRPTPEVLSPDAPGPRTDGPEAAPKQDTGTALVTQAEASGSSGAGDAWDTYDWGRIRSKERREAAINHIDKLRSHIKPEMVRAFLRRLEDGVDPAAEGIHVNGKYVDWDSFKDEPEKINGFINALAETFKDVYDRAGDKARSWADTDKLKSLFGTSLSQMAKTHADVVKEGGISARVGALVEAALDSDRQLMDQLDKLQSKLNDGEYNAQDLADFAGAVERTVLMDSMAAGATSEVARALNYMKRIRRPRAANNDLMQSVMDDLANSVNGGKPLDPTKLKDAVGKLREGYKKGGSTRMRDELRKMRKWGVSEYLAYYATGNLLSGFTTHLRNAVGTPLITAFSVAERYIAVGVGAARQLTPARTNDRVTLAEANAYVGGIQQSLMEGLAAGFEAFKRGGPVQDLESHQLVGSMANFIPFQITAERRAGWARNWYKPGTLVDVTLSGLFSAVRTLGYRPSVAADAMYQTIGRRMQLNALAHREAYFKSRMADPAKAAAVYQTTLKALQEDPTAEAFDIAKAYFKENDLDPKGQFEAGSRGDEMAMILQSIDHKAMAMDHARLLTFQKSGEIVNKVDAALRAMPAIRILYANFIKTPLNLLRAGLVDRNPAIAFLLKDNREALSAYRTFADESERALARGGAEADLMLSKLATGTALMGWAWMMWANGDLVGAQTTMEQQAGVKPYSIKLPNGQWLQYRPLSPVAEMLGVVSDVANALRHHDADDDSATALVGITLSAISSTVFSMSMLQDLQELFDTLNPKYASKDPKKRAEQAGMGVAKAFVPRAVPGSSLARSIAYEIDPVMRDARSFLDQFKALTPLLTETLPAQRDFLGRLMLRQEGERGPLQAYRVTKEKTDPLGKALVQLARDVPGFEIDKPNRKFNGEDITPQEYSRLLEVQGQLVTDEETGMNMEESLRALVQTPEYAEMDPLRREYAIKQTVTKFRRWGTAAVKDPDSGVYMGDMVRRTGAARLKDQVLTRDLNLGKAQKAARSYGVDLEDPELATLREALALE